MKLWEAIREVMAGKKVRRTNWIEGVYIKLVGETIRLFRDGTQAQIIELDSSVVSNDPWEVAEEKTTFGKLQPGDRFIRINKEYMKMHQYQGYNAVCCGLANNWFTDNAEVIKVD